MPPGYSSGLGVRVGWGPAYATEETYERGRVLLLSSSPFELLTDPVPAFLPDPVLVVIAFAVLFLHPIMAIIGILVTELVMAALLRTSY